MKDYGYGFTYEVSKYESAIWLPDLPGYQLGQAVEEDLWVEFLDTFDTLEEAVLAIERYDLGLTNEIRVSDIGAVIEEAVVLVYPLTEDGYPIDDEEEIVYHAKRTRVEIDYGWDHPEIFDTFEQAKAFAEKQH